MDDFSWGNTRVITGEKGRQVVITDEGKFDPKSIPKKRWEEYQAELWEAQTQRDETEADARSMVSGISYATKSNFNFGGAQTPVPPMPYSDYAGAYGNGGPRSNYGYTDYYGVPSRPMSTAPPRYPSASNMSVANLHPAGTSPQPPGYPSGLPGGGYEMSELQSGNQSMIGGMTGSMHGVGQPSDDALLAEIRDILSKADLMTVTKKSVVKTLEQRFGVSLEHRKMYIGSATEAILGGQL